MNNRIENPTVFFAELGGLHDANIDRTTLNFLDRSIEIEIDDLNANFDGLPEYSGKRPSVLIFDEVKNLEISCDGLPGDTQRVYRLELQKNADSGQVAALILISPSGRMSFEFGTVAIKS